MFCRLEKDQKTFGHFNYYKQYITINRIEKIDNDIQLIELSEHCRRNHTNDQYEWCIKNATSMRIYLNTLKVFFIIMECSEDSLDFENFKKKVDKFNKQIDLMETIFSV